MVKIKLPKRLIAISILMTLIMILIIGTIVSLINEKGRIQSALSLSQRNREQLLKTEGVTESLLLVEARFNEYCATFNTRVFNEYKTQAKKLSEKIGALQQTLLNKSIDKRDRLGKIFEEKSREAEVYLKLKQITDSLMLSVSNLEQMQEEIEKTFSSRVIETTIIPPVVDTISVSEVHETYKKGLFGKLKSAIVGEKVQQKVNTKLKVRNPAETVKTTVQTNQPATTASDNIKELIRKNFELKNSELKLIYINNSLIAGIRKLVSDVKTSIKNHEASQNSSFLNSVRQSTNLLENTLIVLMILAGILAGYILLLAYRNYKFQKHIIALNQKVMKDSVEKDKFFSIIGHDLMNPFNTLLGFSNMLNQSLETGTKEEFAEYTSVIHDSAKRLFNLLQNLLVWARMQNGTMTYSPQKVKIDELVLGNVMILKPLAQNKEIELRWSVEADVPVTMDSNMISSVLQNLVTNAIKYTEQGGEVTVSVTQEPDTIKFQVSDTGIGMSDEQKGKLFRLDKTASHRGTENEVGTGLGLIIAKEFVEIHKGKIWAESALGEGSKFFFTIPLKA